MRLLLILTLLLSSFDVNGQSAFQRWKDRRATEALERAKAEERLRRRLFRERVIRDFSSGLGKRLKRRSNLFFWAAAVGGGVILLYICSEGGLGCNGREEEK